MASVKGIDISVLGVPELQGQLERMDLKMQTQIVGQAINEALGPILASAKAKCPKRTGRTANSLTIVKTRKKRNIIVGRIAAGKREELGIRPDDPYYYPMALETGHKRAAARPFLRPALAEGEAQALATVSDRIRSGLEASK